MHGLWIPTPQHQRVSYFALPNRASCSMHIAIKEAIVVCKHKGSTSKKTNRTAKKMNRAMALSALQMLAIMVIAICAVIVTVNVQKVADKLTNSLIGQTNNTNKQ